MNRTRTWLAVPLACLAGLVAPAAPVPEGVPASQGPISDYLRQHDLLPATAAPTATKATLRGDTLEVDRVVSVYRTEEREATVQVQEMVAVPEERERVVQRDGRDVKEKYTVVVPHTVTREVVQRYVVTVQVPVTQRVALSVKGCKFFTTTRDGKLEAIDTDKATAQLNKGAVVLTGPMAEVDPRHLEAIKPGTLYLVLAPSAPQEDRPPPFPMPPVPPDERPRRR